MTGINPSYVVSVDVKWFAVTQIHMVTCLLGFLTLALLHFKNINSHTRTDFKLIFVNVSVSNSEVHTLGERLEEVVGNVFVMLVKCGRGTSMRSSPQSPN